MLNNNDFIGSNGHPKMFLMKKLVDHFNIEILIIQYMHGIGEYNYSLLLCTIMLKNKSLDV